MSNEDVLKKFLSRIENLEKRVDLLERDPNKSIPIGHPSAKILTLAEIIREKKFRSGQEKIAIIVGFYEKIAHKAPIKESDLKEGWRVGKFDGKYNPNFLARAASWVRNINSNLDLSQTGEKFFDDFLKSTDGNNQK